MCYGRRSSRDRGTSRKDRAVSDECLRILLTWYTIEGDRAVSREARRAPEASKGTLTTLVAAKRLGRRHPANTYPTIQKTKQKTNVPRCSDARISCSPPPSLSRSTFSAHAEVNKTGVSRPAWSDHFSFLYADFACKIQLKFIARPCSILPKHECNRFGWDRDNIPEQRFVKRKLRISWTSEKTR